MKAALTGLILTGSLLSGGAAMAAGSSFVMYAATRLDNPRAAYGFVDTPSIVRNGDEADATVLIVVGRPEGPQGLGLSHMVSTMKISCAARTIRLVATKSFDGLGRQVADFANTAPADPVTPRSPNEELFNMACASSQLRPNDDTYPGVAEAVAFVRSVVDATDQVGVAYLPHRFAPAGILGNATEGLTASFIDLANLEHEGDTTLRWMLYVPQRPISRPGSESPVAYEVVQFAFDCQARRFRPRFALAYSAAGALVGSDVRPGPWSGPFPAGSTGEHRLALACGTPPAADMPDYDSIAKAIAAAQQRMAVPAAEPPT